MFETRARGGPRGGTHVSHAHDGVRVRIRQGPDQHAVDDAEHRGVGACAQREYQHDGGGEAGPAPQPTEGVTHVPDQVVEPAPAPDVAGAFADQGGVAQLALRRPVGVVLRQAGFALPLALQLQVERNSASRSTPA